MADFKRGIKAALIAVTVYIVFSVILSVVVSRLGLRLIFRVRSIFWAAGFHTFFTPAGSAFMYISIIRYIITRGFVFGSIFAALYNFLPGNTSVGRGVVFSLFLWAVTAIQSVYTSLGNLPTVSGGIAQVSLESVRLASVSIVSTLAFGALAGFMWDRFG